MTGPRTSSRAGSATVTPASISFAPQLDGDTQLDISKLRLIIHPENFNGVLRDKWIDRQLCLATASAMTSSG